MNYAIMLAGGVGQRMRTSGLPKQFLTVFGKTIMLRLIYRPALIVYSPIATFCFLNEIPPVTSLITGGILMSCHRVIPKRDRMICLRLLPLNILPSFLICIAMGIFLLRLC